MGYHKTRLILCFKLDYYKGNKCLLVYFLKYNKP